MSWGTVELLEVFWTLAALPGLWIWSSSYFSARKTMKALRAANIHNGRRVWGKFSVLLTGTFAGIEFLFVTIGVISMLRTSPPDSQVYTRLITAGCLITASLLITYLAYRWKVIDETLISMAKKRNADTAAQDVREAEQNDREVEQNARDVATEAREHPDGP